MAGHVYLVDDDVGFRGSLAAILGSLSLECEEFDNPEAILALEAFQRPACVVLDYRLPSLSGLEVLKRIRSRSRIPVVLISAYADVKLAVAAMQAGAAAVFEKPLDDNEFLSFIERACFLDREFHGKRQRCRDLQHTLAELSPAESEVLRLMLRGLPNKAIASELGKSVKAVERNRQLLLGKLGCNSGIEAVIKVSTCPLSEDNPLLCLSTPCAKVLDFS